VVPVAPPVRSFLAGDAKSLLIGDRWVAARSGETFAAINPATAETLGSAAAGDAADVDAAVAAARAAFEAPSWAGMAAHDRTRLLLRIADTIEAHAEELAQIETINNGVPLAINRWIIGGVVQTFRYYAGWPTKIYGETNPGDPGVFNYTLREPIGVCGHIVPWNGPLSMAAWKIAPAIACGNTVVLKPAEQTPLSTVRLGELLLEADLPPGVVNIVTGLGETAGAAIAAHRGIDKVAFTGSTDVGKKILAASIGNLKRVTLELGGKSPNIVFADADLQAAALAATQGFCLLSGQFCTAGSRILVHESIHDQFAEMVAGIAGAMVVGDPFDAQTTMGPLISAEQFARVTGYFEIGRRDGAHLHLGGESLDRPGYFVKPTIFTRGRNDMRIAREEIFGPVTVLIPFRDEAEAVRLANDTDFGLAAAVWTSDISRAQRMTRALKAGTVWINTYGQVDLISPFGGYKQSGIGRELGRQSIDAYTETKSVFAKIN
jgi:acyl-CoA reductase-like NAD-dependent aldehyde dehydrogenase